jgi:nucleoside-diphosphate-sugar epimerase
MSRSGSTPIPTERCVQETRDGSLTKEGEVVRVLLTGPCGRIGYTTFTRLLEAGHEVRCFDTKTGFLGHPDGFNESIERFWRNKGYSFEWQWGDVRNPNDVRQAVDDDIDAIIHHAAMTLPTHCEEEWEYCWDVNFFGTLNVIDAVSASPRSPKLLYSSSVANYGYPVEGKEQFVESDPLTPTCTYAATKIAAELAIRRAGINYTIMRIGSVLDARAPHLAMMADPDFIARSAKESRIKSSGSPAHFVSSDDVNTAYLNALDNLESDRRTFNLVGPADCRTTFGSMRDEVSAALGGSSSLDDHWGSGPYPQHYYDPAPSDSVLHYVRTGWAGIIANMRNAVDDIAEFMSLSAAD